MAPLAVVVRNDDEAASLLDGDGGGGGSPVLSAGVSALPQPAPLIHGKATKKPSHDVMRLIRSPFAAVLRMTTCKRADDAISPSDKQPGKNTAARAAVAERRREATIRRRPSLEQLLRLEAAPPPTPSRRPDRKSKRGTTAPPAEVVPTCAAAAMNEKRAHEPLSPYKIHSTVVVVPDDDERHRPAAPAAPDAVKLDVCGGRRTSAERLVVVVASSLRACSRAPETGISAVRKKPKGPNGKKAAAAGRAPGKAELFYYRPIPMGRRCRVQHLEESPYK